MRSRKLPRRNREKASNLYLLSRCEDLVLVDFPLFFCITGDRHKATDTFEGLDSCLSSVFSRDIYMFVVIKDPWGGVKFDSEWIMDDHFSLPCGHVGLVSVILYLI